MNGPVLRILDANANRAREALRVIEDYVRFWLNDRELGGQLKTLRHDLTAATKQLVDEAIFHRDTPGDVGTDVKTSAELYRQDVTDVIRAAGKRMGEALRAMEEVLKILDLDAAVRVESLRYRFYTLEQQVVRTLRSTERFRDVRLYVLITESACKKPWKEVAREAIRGGADCLQLREKGLDGGELLDRAREFVRICQNHGVLSIINDRPDIAVLANAHGVHVGQDDLPVPEVRKIVGREKIVGVSTHNLEQAKRAMSDGADYIGVGPVFRSGTKTRDFLPGLEYARLVAETIEIPAVAIAGITEQNVDEVLATRIKAIAVTAAVAGSDNPRRVAERLKQKLVV